MRGEFCTFQSREVLSCSPWNPVVGLAQNSSMGMAQSCSKLNIGNRFSTKMIQLWNIPRGEHCPKPGSVADVVG